MTKKLLLLLTAPLFLVGCNATTSNPTGFNDWMRIDSYQIFGGGQNSNYEPTYQVYAIYQSAESLESITSIKSYGEDHKDIYVRAGKENYDKYNFKKTATLTYGEGTSSLSVTFKEIVVQTKFGRELYYSPSGRTLKVLEWDNALDKVFNKSIHDQMKGYICYYASLSESQTTINATSYYGFSGYVEKETETYIDLGTTAVSYSPYKTPEN